MGAGSVGEGAMPVAGAGWVGGGAGGDATPQLSWPLPSPKKDGDEWKPVENPSGYEVKKDSFTTVTFAPVKTKDLKLEFQCRREGGRYAADIYEWRIE